MKKFMICMVILVLVCVGISWASESNGIRIYKAEELMNSKIRVMENVYSRTDKVVRGHSIYLRLIYQEEKKQTKLLEQIWSRMNEVKQNGRQNENM